MISQKSLLSRTLPVIIQCASAHRKPLWMPVAKSKIFRIPKRPVIPDEDRKELLRINNNYKTQVRAIRRFFYEEMIKEKSTLDSAGSEMNQKQEADEWKRCVALNDAWNAEVAAEREQRRKKELAEKEELALAYMEAKDKELRARIEKASEEIRIQKELSTTFITPETLDAAIDHALANPFDYNYAIDLQGKKYQGRETPVERQNMEQKEAANV